MSPLFPKNMEIPLKSLLEIRKGKEGGGGGGGGGGGERENERKGKKSKQQKNYKMLHIL